MAWAGSTRSARLPPDWPQRRPRVLRRDSHTCQLQYAGCTHHATEVDHIVNNDDHALTNLQAVCTWCHNIKTRTEARAARTYTTTKHPTEQHPGLT